MSREDVETVRRVFEAFTRGDVEAVVAAAHPEVVFTAPETARLSGHTGPYVGHDGLRQYFGDVAATWDQLEVEPMDFRAVAGSVVIFGRVRGSRPGMTVDTSVIWTWRLRDGRILSGSVFSTRADAPSPRTPAEPAPPPPAARAPSDASEQR